MVTGKAEEAIVGDFLLTKLSVAAQAGRDKGVAPHGIEGRNVNSGQARDSANHSGAKPTVSPGLGAGML